MNADSAQPLGLPSDGADADRPEAALLADVLDIAERTLWNPSRVSFGDMQKLAAAVIAHVRVQQRRAGRGSDGDPRGATDGSGLSR